MNVKIAHRIAIAAVITTAAIGAAPASAYAWLSGIYGATAFSYGSNGQIAVTDTEADGNPVYADYYRRNGSGEQFLWNYSGAAKTVYSKLDESHPITWMRACVAADTGHSCGLVRS